MRKRRRIFPTRHHYRDVGGGGVPLELPPNANFTSDVTEGAVPLTVNYTDTSSRNPTTWLWLFGDGQTSGLQNPSRTYIFAGTFDVQLDATNANGTDTELKVDYITSADLPVAAFSGTPLSGSYPLSVQFTDASTNVPTSWLWDFGDGGSSTEQNPLHEYATGAEWTVTLTVTNAAGSDDEVKINYIDSIIYAPVAAFSGLPSSGASPLEVQFTDASTNTPTSWAWTFGDGGTSTAQNPLYEYAIDGDYTVSLTATNAGGSDIETKVDYIRAGVEPHVAIDLSPQHRDGLHFEVTSSTSGPLFPNVGSAVVVTDAVTALIGNGTAGTFFFMSDTNWATLVLDFAAQINTSAGDRIGFYLQPSTSGRMNWRHRGNGGAATVLYTYDLTFNGEEILGITWGGGNMRSYFGASQLNTSGGVLATQGTVESAVFGNNSHPYDGLARNFDGPIGAGLYASTEITDGNIALLRTSMLARTVTIAEMDTYFGAGNWSYFAMEQRTV